MSDTENINNNTFFSGKIYLGKLLKNQAPLFFHISRVSVQIRHRKILVDIFIGSSSLKDLANEILGVEEAAIGFLYFIRDSFVNTNADIVVVSTPHFLQTYLQQSLHKTDPAPRTENFSLHKAQEQTHWLSRMHLFPQLLLFDLAATIETLRFILSRRSTSLPTRSCSDRSKTSARLITWFKNEIIKNPSIRLLIIIICSNAQGVIPESDSTEGHPLLLINKINTSIIRFCSSDVKAVEF